jgi:polar amino acid transport system substrate-binding protein
MKKIVLALSLVFVLLIMGCSSSDTTKDVTSDTSTDVSSEPASGESEDFTMETLNVYTNANFPPYEYMKGTDVVGVDMDIAQAIADELGAELEITNDNFDGLISGLASGKGDIAISGFTISPERQAEVDFSIPYINTVQYLILPKDSEIATMEDLAGKKIAAALGYSGDMLLDSEIKEGALMNKNVTKTTVNSALDGSMDIQNGRLDALVMDEFVAKKIVSENDALKAIELKYADRELEREEYGVAVPKGNPELLAVINEVIERLIAANKIEEWVLSHSNS